MSFRVEHDELLAPLWRVLPLNAAMPALLPRHAASAEAIAAVRAVVKTAPLRDNPSAQAALWLYVDELDTSHSLSQDLHHTTGSFLHGIMHRREGDFSNSHYWMRRTGTHPIWQQIPGYDPDAFIDAVAAARGSDPPALLQRQRAEWQAIMAYCLEHTP